MPLAPLKFERRTVRHPAYRDSTGWKPVIRAVAPSPPRVDPLSPLSRPANCIDQPFGKEPIMADKRKKTAKSPTRSRGNTRSTKGKVGSDPKAARQIGGKRDFGVPEAGSVRDRQYVSEEIKANDPGRAPEHSGNTGNRVTGAGGNASGVGSSSGGDVDTDLIGVGTGGTGIAQDGPDRTDGADMVGGDQPVSEAFASKNPPKG